MRGTRGRVLLVYMPEQSTDFAKIKTLIFNRKLREKLGITDEQLMKLIGQYYEKINKDKQEKPKVPVFDYSEGVETFLFKDTMFDNKTN